MSDYSTNTSRRVVTLDALLSTISVFSFVVLMNEEWMFICGLYLTIIKVSIVISQSIVIIDLKTSKIIRNIYYFKNIDF